LVAALRFVTGKSRVKVVNAGRQWAKRGGDTQGESCMGDYGLRTDCVRMIAAIDGRRWGYS